MKHHLLAVAGLSPAVVTETIWALARRRPSTTISHVHVLTTTRGQDLLHRHLCGVDCSLHRLAAMLDRPVPDVSIHLVETDNGPIADIRTVDDYTALADSLVRLVPRLTGDPTTALHASLAGGRKSMSFYMGYVMSLFARPQDELSHVLLADERFERCADFFYPTDEPTPVTYTDHATGHLVNLDASEAKIDLAPIPFVRIRFHLSDQDRERMQRLRYAEVVASVEQALEPPRLHLVPRQRLIRAGRQEFSLPHREYALYWLLARRRQAAAHLSRHDDVPPGWLAAGRLGDEGIADVDEYLVLLDRLLSTEHRPGTAFRDRLADAAKQSDDGYARTERSRLFSEVKAKLKRALAKAAPDPMLRHPYEIKEAAVAGGGGRCFGLVLDGDSITIEGDPKPAKHARA